MGWGDDKSKWCCDDSSPGKPCRMNECTSHNSVMFYALFCFAATLACIAVGVDAARLFVCVFVCLRALA